MREHFFEVVYVGGYRIKGIACLSSCVRFCLRICVQFDFSLYQVAITTPAKWKKTWNAVVFCINNLSALCTIHISIRIYSAVPYVIQCCGSQYPYLGSGTVQEAYRFGSLASDGSGSRVSLYVCQIWEPDRTR